MNRRDTIKYVIKLYKSEGHFVSYFLLMLEGLLTFISPCLLPMIPIYLAYIAGESGKSKVIQRAVQFVLGFTFVFVLLSLLISSLGQFFVIHRTSLRWIAGLIIIMMGCDFLLDNPLLSKITLPTAFSSTQDKLSRSSPFLLGIAFAISWTPCVGTFLASALAYSATASHIGKSILLLLAYCFGLGLPFILSAILIEESQKTFAWLKNHPAQIRFFGGILLIIMGLLTAFGYMDQLLTHLSSRI